MFKKKKKKKKKKGNIYIKIFAKNLLQKQIRLKSFIAKCKGSNYAICKILLQVTQLCIITK